TTGARPRPCASSPPAPRAPLRHRSHPLQAGSASTCVCSARHRQPEFFPELPFLSSFPSNSHVASALFNRQEEPERTPLFRSALTPNLSAMRLHQSLGNSQSQAHAGGIAIHTHEIFKNFLVVLSRNSAARVCDAHFDAVRPRQAEPPPLLAGRDVCYPAFPKMRLG